MSIETEAPWFAQYRAGTPRHLEPEFDNALEMFAAAVRANPDRTSLVYFDDKLSLTEVDHITDALAAGLVGLGFQPGDRLAVYLQNVPQFVLAMIATWKAGGTMVSINPMNKSRELEYLLTDSGATVLVTLDSLYEEVARRSQASSKSRKTSPRTN